MKYPFKSLFVWIISAVVLAAVVVGGFWFFIYHASTPLQDVATSFNSNNLDGAVTKADTMLASNPGDVKALVAKSLALAQKGSLGFKEIEYGAQAADIAKQAIQADPENSEAYRALGYADEIQQKYADAHTAYEKSISLDPKNALAVSGNAHVFDLEGDKTKAEAGYLAALAIDPNCFPAHTGLGRIYNSKGDAAKATEEFKIVYHYSPNIHDQAEAAYSVGMLLITQRDVPLARGYLEKATTLDPSYPLGWYGLGTVLYAQATASSSISTAQRASLLIGSVNSLNQSIALNPGQSVAYLQLAEDQYVLGDKAGAITTLSQAAAAVSGDITLSAAEKPDLLKRITALQASFKKAK